MHQWFDLSVFSGVPAASLYSDWAATPARSGPVSRGSSPVARVAAKRPVIYRRCPEPANICFVEVGLRFTKGAGCTYWLA